MSEWFYQADGVEKGPVSSDELKRLARAGTVRPDTPIRKGTGGNWVSASHAKGLFPPSSGDSASPGSPGTGTHPSAHNPPALPQAAPRSPNATPAEQKRLSADAAVQERRFSPMLLFGSIGAGVVLVICISIAIVAIGFRKTRQTEGNPLETRKMQSGLTSPPMKPVAKPSVAPPPAAVVKPDPAPAAVVKPDPAPAPVPMAESPWATFRGIPWGAKIEDCPDMVLVRDSGFNKVYRRTGEKLEIGDVPLLWIEYTFFEGRFYSVYIFCENYPAGEARLQEALEARYGTAETIGRSYRWKGGDVSIGKASGSELIMVHYTYHPIASKSVDAARARDEKRAKRAAKDF